MDLVAGVRRMGGPEHLGEVMDEKKAHARHAGAHHTDVDFDG